MDELGLPEHLKLLTRYHNGLILVTGSVGSGKSTTLAALVEQVNVERREHIITLEDPIEYSSSRKVATSPSAKCTRTPLVRRGSARRAARRSRRDHGRRNARPRNDLARHHRVRNGTPCSRHASHWQCLTHTRSVARCFPGRSTGADSHHGQRIVARNHQSAARCRAPTAWAGCLRLEL